MTAHPPGIDREVSVPSLCTLSLYVLDELDLCYTCHLGGMYSLYIYMYSLNWNYYTCHLAGIDRGGICPLSMYSLYICTL